MSRRLTATGAFKRMSGDWMPASDRFLYENNDKIFAKRTGSTDYEQVGGGGPGDAPAESARILFWNGKCRMCDLNLVTVRVRTGMANTGKLVLTMSRDENFQEGWFVAVESVMSQIDIPLLTLRDDGVLRKAYSEERIHTRRFEQDPIAEDATFINWPLPSLNLITVPDTEYWGIGHVDNVFDRMDNLIFQSYAGYTSATDRSLPAASEPQQFTARFHRVSCGTVLEGDRNTISTQSVWTGIVADNYPPGADMWIGLGDNFVRAGLNRRLFLPPMQLTHLERDRLQSPNRYWKVDAIPGDILTVKDQFGSTRSRSTSGIAASSATGTRVIGTHVTESPKARNMRSTLVTSPEGLIWSGGAVLPGINEEHTNKAIKTPATVFPFDQPQQSTELSVGAEKATPASLTVSFTTTASRRIFNYSNYTESNEPLPPTSDYLKPAVRVRQRFVEDETGRIGRSFNGWDVATTDYTEVPQNEPWIGVFDEEIELMQSTPDSNIFNASFYYGGSDQTQNWLTRKIDDYNISIESLSDLPYEVMRGVYVGTNVMPDGTPSSLDMFYAAPEIPEISATPTLSQPLVLSPIAPGQTGYNSYYDATLVRRNQYDGGGGGVGVGSEFVDSVFSFAGGIPFLYAHRQVIGAWQGTGGFIGYTVLEFNPGYQNTEYKTDSFDSYYGLFLRDIAGWRRMAESHSNTATKLSSQLTFSAVRTLTQGIPSGQDPSSATPQSEFYKASPSQFDDYMTRLCEASRITVVKSCRWIPKQTQMFISIDREDWSTAAAIPGGWGYYGGTVPEEDRLEMLDQYESTGRFKGEPKGGVISFVIRRTWQIELILASGAATYTPMEVVSDDLQTVTQYADTRFGGFVGASVSFIGTRQATCGVEFDLESAETVTHLMSHQQTTHQTLTFTELEWERLEAGEAVEKSVVYGNNARVSPLLDPAGAQYIDTKTKVVFQFT